MSLGAKQANESLLKKTKIIENRKEDKISKE